MTITKNPDVTYSWAGGSIAFVTPVTDRGRKWIEHNVQDQQWFGGAMVVEPRYLENLLDGMQRDGLVLA